MNETPGQGGGFDIARSAQALDNWMADQQYCSWDPYDALTSPFLAALRQNPLGARLCLQIVKRCPITLRPFLHIRKRLYTKAISDLLSAGCIDPHPGADASARIGAWAEALVERRLPGNSGSCWGMDLPYASRFTVATPETPNLFQTVNAVIALLDAWEHSGNDRYRAIATEVLPFLETGLGRLVDTDEHIVWRYYPGADAVVYNVNALIGATLARLAQANDDDALAVIAERTMRAVVDAQNQDGSWWYAAAPRGRWVDGFHSGYILEAFLEYTVRTHQDNFEEPLNRGMRFFRKHLLVDGQPQYTPDHCYPIDIQNCAQAIQVLAKWSLYRKDPDAQKSAIKAFEATCRHLQVWEGPDRLRFKLQRGRLLANDLPAIRWGLAPMLLALRWLQRANQQLPNDTQRKD